MDLGTIGREYRVNVRFDCSIRFRFDYIHINALLGLMAQIYRRRIECRFTQRFVSLTY